MAFLKQTHGKVTMVHKNLVCSCDSDEHQLNFRFFTEDKDDDFIYCTMHLVPERNIFKRMLGALKYTLGHKSKYGEFDEVLLNKEKIEELKCLIASYEKFKEGE